MTGRFAIGERDFLLDGQPFRVLAGAIHYFRVHPDHWADRIHKARLMGLNTIETYVPWNAHAPVRGEFRTDGPLDLAHFLDLVAAEGLYAIVRPGPFICAEWDNGGLPAWLFQNATVGVRRNEPQYLAAVAEYFEQVLPIVAERQIDRRGAVILVQIENEYGAYGRDQDYLTALVELNRAHGITVPLTTIDQPTDQMLQDGSLPELHKTGSFGARRRERLATLRRHQPTGPLMCAEFWNGWFDHWGAHHHTTSAVESARELDELLATGASVNLYMFHGGTNFGFTNGANDKGVFQPTITSYDYDAPLSESGQTTEKYHAFREVLARYTSVPDELPDRVRAAPAFEVSLWESVSLWDALEVLGVPADEAAAGVEAVVPAAAGAGLPTMDAVGQYSGFALYRTRVAPGAARVLSFAEVRDRAQVFLDGVPVGVLQRDNHDRSLTLPSVGDGDAAGRLDVLVEDQGRVNYGPRIGEAKGLIGPALLDTEEPAWQVVPLRLDAVTGLGASLFRRGMPGGSLAGPAFARGRFVAEPGVDLFLSVAGWGKGQAWLNGFNLGRFWDRGPQVTLYVPGPVLTAGENELVILALSGAPSSVARFLPAPDLGYTDL